MTLAQAIESLRRVINSATLHNDAIRDAMNVLSFLSSLPAESVPTMRKEITARLKHTQELAFQISEELEYVLNDEEMSRREHAAESVSPSLPYDTTRECCGEMGCERHRMAETYFRYVVEVATEQEIKQIDALVGEAERARRAEAESVNPTLCDYCGQPECPERTGGE